MTYKTVVLSDGLPCKVRQLSLFELDGRGRELLGPFRYSILTATGQIIEDEYNLRDLTETPTAPDIPANEILQGTPEWYQLQEFDTYTAALAHEKLRIEAYEGYVSDIVHYILATCLSPDDQPRVIEVEDWDAVYFAALVPQLTEEGLAECLRLVFQGELWESGDARRSDDYARQRQGQGVGASAMGA